MFGTNLEDLDLICVELYRPCSEMIGMIGRVMLMRKLGTTLMVIHKSCRHILAMVVLSIDRFC